MPDALFPITGRDVVLKYRDMGDGTVARVVALSYLDAAGAKTYRVSGRALTQRYQKAHQDATHAEVHHVGASAQATDKLVPISGRGITLRYRRLADGTHAECVWAGPSSKSTDVIFPVSGRDISVRYRDMGDGTHALVVWTQPSNKSTDKRYQVSARGITIKYRDMGDGTYAEVLHDYLAPTYLFAAGEQGAWYDPSDFSTLFQNAAGTTPVTAVEQPVRLMLDKSGRGNHALAPSDTARPVLRARYNLLTYSEQFNDAAWSKAGLSPPIVTANQATAPDGTLTADRAVYTSPSAGSRVEHSVAFSATSYTLTVYAKSNTGTTQTIALYKFDGTAETNSGNLSVGTDWVRLSWTFSAVAGSGSINIRAGSGLANVDVFIWGADLRVTNDALNQPSYQRVGAASDYDTNGFLPFLAFDGSDDAMSTSAIDFSGTDKMTVFAGVRKLSDAANAIIAEIGVAGPNGSFRTFAPGGAIPGSDKYAFVTRGTTDSPSATTSSAFNAPVTNVLTGISDISSDVSILRINGAQVATNSADQGTGNYGNHSLFIGARNNASLFFNGRIYSLTIVGRAVNSGELAAMEAYTNQKTAAY